MKQVLFSITLAKDKKHTFLKVQNPCYKSWYTNDLLYTLIARVFPGILANIIELKTFYSSFKSFYDSASTSAGS